MEMTGSGISHYLNELNDSETPLHGFSFFSFYGKINLRQQQTTYLRIQSLKCVFALRFCSGVPSVSADVAASSVFLSCESIQGSLGFFLVCLDTANNQQATSVESHAGITVRGDLTLTPSSVFAKCKLRTSE